MTDRTPISELEQITKVSPEPYQSSSKSDGLNTYTWEKIPTELYKYFGTNPIDGDPALREISDWAGDGAKTLSDYMKRIKNLEVKLGAPNNGENRITKMSNWIRMDRAMRDATVSYKTEMDSIKNSHSKRLKELKDNYKDRVGRLEAEIAKIEQSYKDAYKSTRKRTMSELSSIKNEYGRQLGELKSLRSVYQRSK